MRPRPEAGRGAEANGMNETNRGGRRRLATAARVLAIAALLAAAGCAREAAAPPPDVEDGAPPATAVVPSAGGAADAPAAEGGADAAPAPEAADEGGAGAAGGDGGADAEEAADTPARSGVISISASPDRIELRADGEPARAIEVIGAYGEGFERPLPLSSGVAFRSSDPAVARVSDGGVVSPAGAGSAEVTASFRGLETTVAVEVAPAAAAAAAPPPAAAAVAVAGGETAIYPNRAYVLLNTPVWEEALAVRVAAAYGGTVVAEWQDELRFLMEIGGDASLADLAPRLDADPDIASWEPQFAETAGR